MNSTGQIVPNFGSLFITWTPQHHFHHLQPNSTEHSSTLCPSLVGCSLSSVSFFSTLLTIQSRTEGEIEASTDGCNSVKSVKGCCELNNHLRSRRKTLLLLTMTQRHLRNVWNSCTGRLISGGETFSWDVICFVVGTFEWKTGWISQDWGDITNTKRNNYNGWVIIFNPRGCIPRWTLCSPSPASGSQLWICVTHMKESITNSLRHTFSSFTLHGIHKGDPRIRYRLDLYSDFFLLVEKSLCNRRKCIIVPARRLNTCLCISTRYGVPNH